jgi:hypothetical protein
MKKRLFIITGTALGIIVASLLVLTLYVKSYLQSDKLKAIIIPKIEELTGRPVSLDAINVSIFSGISVQGIHVKEKDGSGDFAAVKEFVLNYNFMPLLHKKLVISSINVIDPFLHVIRDENGRFNYEDIIEAAKSHRNKKEDREQKPSGGIPFSVTADKIGISNARIEFADSLNELPRLTALSDADLKISAGSESGGLKFSGGAKVKSLTAAMGSMTILTSGTIEVEPETVSFSLNTLIGPDSVAITGSAKNYLTAPDIRLDLYSRKLDFEKLIAMSGGMTPKEKKSAGSQRRSRTGTDTGTERGKKIDMRVSGEIKVDTGVYQGNIAKNISMKYQYASGLANISPISLQFMNGQKADMSGVLKGNLAFEYMPEKGAASDQIKRTLTGKETVDLDKLQIRQSRITDAVALFTGLDDLRRPAFNKGHLDISIKDERMFVTGLMISPRLKVSLSGTIGFNKELALLSDIEVSPDMAAQLRVAKFTSYLEGKDGWTLIPMKITGTTDKPSAGPNQAALKKQVQNIIQREIQKHLGGSQQQGEKPQDLIRGLFGK